MGRKIFIHNKTGKQKSWDQRGRDGFNKGLDLEHYRYLSVIDTKTNFLIISDTVEFMHSYIMQPTPTHE